MTVRATRYLLPTLRDAPGDAVAESHKLFVRAGMVKQVGAGLWTWLPLGWRVKNRVQEIVREEMDRIGGQEMLMPVLHPAEIWKRSGRFDIDVVFHLRDRADRELVLAITHEEIVALHASQTIRSYRDLPQIWYHIQIKERDEARPQGGVLRTREFTMKDSYTLDRDQAGLDAGYAKHEEAYDRIYRRCGLDVLQGRVRHGPDGRDHGACIPTKAMVQSAHAYNDAQGHFAQLGVRLGNIDLDFEQVQSNRRGIVDGVVKGLAGLLKGNGIQVVQGRGRFTGPEHACGRGRRGHPVQERRDRDRLAPRGAADSRHRPPALHRLDRRARAGRRAAAPGACSAAA